MRFSMLASLLLVLPVTVFGVTACHHESSQASPSTTARPTPVAPQNNPSAPTGQGRSTDITVALTGDFLIHETVWQAATTGKGFDFSRLIAPVTPTIQSADLSLCHLETPLAPPSGPYSSYPLFSVPPQLLSAIKTAGFDGCSTASNHSVDQGFTGLKRTVEDLDKAGLKHTGTYATPTHAPATFYTVKGFTVATLSYTYGTNGMPVEHPWSVNLIDPAKITADAQWAKAQGAHVVLVALHWGQEYQTSPTPEQLALADALTRDPNITVVYGHHAHVVQPYRKINGKWVIFGLGNFLAGQHGYRSGVDDGVIASVKITIAPDGQATAQEPTYIHTHIGQDLVVRRSA